MVLQLSSAVAKTQSFAALLLLGGTVLCTGVPVCLAQTDSPMTIRVESSEVVVPVVVTDKSYARESRFFIAGGEYANRTYGKEIGGLSAKDFHVFEDGMEQRIQNVSVKRLSFWGVLDNVSGHFESSCSPRGIWSNPDLWPQTHITYDDQPAHVYLVSYVPPPSPEGSCHRIQVKVNSDHASVSARDQYCNIKHAPSDRLNGTKLAIQMEDFANSAQDGMFPVSVQVGFFFVKSGANRLAIAVEFPASALKRVWHGGKLKATIAVLGLVYDENRSVVARFSDSDCHTSSYSIPRTMTPLSQVALGKEYNYIAIPDRYETQIDLPAGDYDLKLVVTDGKKFGRAKVPLSVEKYDWQSLAMSSVILCKRFHKVPGSSEQEARPPEYVPLALNGLEFTPAGDTRFSKGDRLMTYFEVYEPLVGGIAATKLQLQIKITDAKTGELREETGLLPAETRTASGNLVIPMEAEVAFDRLRPGSYRLEIQASDSAGNKTSWRAASFTVE